MTQTGQLLDHVPDARAEERFETLLARGPVRIERIVSAGQASPPDFWYDQTEDEFVVLMAGAARLRFADDDRALDLRPGHWLHIPAHRRHRVETTQADPPTIWLAVFFPHADDAARR